MCEPTDRVDQTRAHHGREFLMCQPSVQPFAIAIRRYEWRAVASIPFRSLHDAFCVFQANGQILYQLKEHTVFLFRTSSPYDSALPFLVNRFYEVMGNSHYQLSPWDREVLRRDEKVGE
jgi:hypothetical protein